MTLTTLALFGVETWRAFFVSLEFSRTNVIEQGAAGFEKIQSVFAAAPALGANVATAYLIQTAVTLATLATLLWLWRSRADGRVKIAATMVATQLTTPHCLDYDMMVSAPRWRCSPGAVSNWVSVPGRRRSCARLPHAAARAPGRHPVRYSFGAPGDDRPVCGNRHQRATRRTGATEPDIRRLLKNRPQDDNPP